MEQTLFNDICTRLPYGLKCQYKAPLEGAFADKPEYYDVIGIPDANSVDIIACGKYRFAKVPIDDIKPYLRPMSSMTDEEFLALQDMCMYKNLEYESNINKFYTLWKRKKDVPYYMYDSNQIDYLISHYLDYRGLIPMGLALEAKEGMYKNF